MLYFIVNEKSRSGKGAEAWREARAILAGRGIRYEAYSTRYEGHALSLAKDICGREDDDICLVVVGGDGTANEVINGMSNFDRVRFGILPVGSGNDFARGLGIKGSTAEILLGILDCVGAGRSRPMDLGQVSFPGCVRPRRFAISAGVGLDALVCKKALKSKLKDALNRLHMGNLTYVFLTVQSLFTMETARAAVRFEKAGWHTRRDAICFAVMNFRAEGGGVPMAPKANPSDGKLSVCCISDIPKWKAFFCLPFLVAGKHTWIKGFEVKDCGVCEIRLGKRMVLHADGEYCGTVDRMRFSCLPGKLRVLV